MRTLFELESAIESAASADELLAIGEEVLEHWVRAHDMEPTSDTREGFRLLALHRQGANGDPSFNACRETARELAYHFNLITMQPEHADTANRLEMLRLICSHLYLFVSGKMQVAQLGDFCCSSKPVRLAENNDTQEQKEA